MKIKNWQKFQHYKSRRPPWIRLYRDLLDDYAFSRLPDASRALAPQLWLLASETMDGALPNSTAEIAFRVHQTEDWVSKAIKPLIQHGFIEDASTVLAPCKQDATSETETETETEADMCTSYTVPPEPGRAADPADGACSRIFAHWRSLDCLTRHPKLTPGMERSIKARLKGGFTEADLTRAITRYAELVQEHQAPGYNRWGIVELCGRGEGSWLSRLLDPEYHGINGNLPPGHSKLSQHNSRVVRNFLEKAKTHE